MTNDPDESRILLTVSAEVAVLFGFLPFQANFGRVLRSRTPRTTLEGAGDALEYVEILSIAVREPQHADYYDIRVEDSGKGPGRKMHLTISTTDKLPLGRFMDTILIQTNLEKTPEIETYLTGEILGPIEWIPRTMILRTSGRNSPLTGNITLKPTGNRAFRILSASFDEPAAEISIHDPGPDHSIKVEMNLGERFKSESIHSDLILMTDLEDQPELVIPVHGFRQL